MRFGAMERGGAVAKELERLVENVLPASALRALKIEGYDFDKDSNLYTISNFLDALGEVADTLENEEHADGRTGSGATPTGAAAKAKSGTQAGAIGSEFPGFSNTLQQPAGVADSAPQICRSFAAGRCNRGETCKFMHVITTKAATGAQQPVAKAPGTEAKAPVSGASSLSQQ